MITTLILGAGDMASGVALRLRRVGLQVVMTELPQPLAVRRTVSFAEAVFTGETTIEGITARRVTDPTDKFRLIQILAKGFIPVLIDPNASAINELHPNVIVDARMRKQRADLLGSAGMVIIGLGPGFEAGVNCSVGHRNNPRPPSWGVSTCKGFLSPTPVCRIRLAFTARNVCCARQPAEN